KDHATVKQLFCRFKQTSERARKTRDHLVDRIATELEIHAQIEEEIFYPTMRAVPDAVALVAEGRQEHEQVETLVSDMQSASDAEAENGGGTTDVSARRTARARATCRARRAASRPEADAEEERREQNQRGVKKVVRKAA